MKKIFVFLWLLLCICAITYVTSSIYVCDTGSTINLKPVGINYECKCSKCGNYSGISCKK